MNIIKNKKIIAVALTFVMIMTLARMPLPAKVRRGSIVVVTMADGNQVKGELLAVKSDTLLVYDYDAGQGKSIDLQQVIQVKILKKSNFFDGFGIGIIIGLVISVSYIKKIDHESLMPIFEIVGSLWPVPVTGLCGGLLGSLASIPQKISMSGTSYQQRQENITQLKRYAREQD